MLLPARTDTKWFHDYCKQAKEIRFIKGRLKFSGSQNAAPFPSMIVVFADHDNSLCKMSFWDVRKDI
jgi:site-specific DNA-methyltransferase (adenine-specific)